MAHVATLVGQLMRIVADGVVQRVFASPDPHATARAVFDATARLTEETGTAAAIAIGTGARLLWASPSPPAGRRKRAGDLIPRP